MKRFLNCKIDISKKVFQPRIETEFWVKKAIKELKIKSPAKFLTEKKINILDIFAGSGCIGIAILKNIKNSFVDFVDIDKKAIEQIEVNLELNKIQKSRYRILRSNLFKKLKDKKYDFILANPPYVAESRIFEVQKSVLEKEPGLALFGGRDGMKYIKRFLSGGKDYLKKGGTFYLEFDPGQKEKIEEICQAQGIRTRFYRDQFRKWRFMRGQLIFC